MTRNFDNYVFEKVPMGFSPHRIELENELKFLIMFFTPNNVSYIYAIFCNKNMYIHYTD